MVSGATGLTGKPAPKHAAPDNSREHVPARTHHQPTEEISALAKLKRHRTATLTHAQVCTLTSRIHFKTQYYFTLSSFRSVC